MTQFKLIKNNQEIPIPREFFNHVNGRQIIAYRMENRELFSACYCKTKDNHFWIEYHFDTERDAIKHYTEMMKNDKHLWHNLIDPNIVFQNIPFYNQSFT